MFRILYTHPLNTNTFTPARRKEGSVSTMFRILSTNFSDPWRRYLRSKSGLRSNTCCSWGVGEHTQNLVAGWGWMTEGGMREEGWKGGREGGVKGREGGKKGWKGGREGRKGGREGG